MSSNDEKRLRLGVDTETSATFDILVAREEVVYLKAVLEAYPGLAGVHAERGRQRGDEVPLTIVTTPELAPEVGEVLNELSGEIPLQVRSSHLPRATTIEAGGRGT